MKQSWPAEVMIRCDGAIEAFYIGANGIEGVSHRFSGDEWWTFSGPTTWDEPPRTWKPHPDPDAAWAFSGPTTWDEPPRTWKPHPDPDAAWARLVAGRLSGAIDNLWA
jgi:hypothetical protein